MNHFGVSLQKELIFPNSLFNFKIMTIQFIHFNLLKGITSPTIKLLGSHLLNVYVLLVVSANIISQPFNSSIWIIFIIASRILKRVLASVDRFQLFFYVSVRVVCCSFINKSWFIILPHHLFKSIHIIFSKLLLVAGNRLNTILLYLFIPHSGIYQFWF